MQQQLIERIPREVKDIDSFSVDCVKKIKSKGLQNPPSDEWNEQAFALSTKNFADISSVQTIRHQVSADEDKQRHVKSVNHLKGWI